MARYLFGFLKRSIMMKISSYFGFVLFLLLSAKTMFSQNPPTPTVNIPFGSATICPMNMGTPSFVMLVSSASSGNVWSNGATTQSINVSSSGNYYVSQVVGNFTSSPSAPVTVSVHPMPNISFPAIGPFCKDAAPVVLQGMPMGLSGFYTYSGMGVSGDTFTPANANQGMNSILTFDYTQIFDGQACQNSASVSVAVLDCVTGLEEESKINNGVLLYSNQLLGHFTLQSTIYKIQELSIVDMCGKDVFALNDTNTHEISLNLSNDPPGIYLLVVKHEQGYVSRKIVKMK